VRVPVRIAHCESVNVEFDRPVSADAARAALASAPGVVLMDERKGEVPQPIHAEEKDHTFVGRVRQDPSNPHAINLWVVADNLRKGAATNAVQCAEELVKRGIVK
jgi:aspartate-semialdehyde dehydrogenase